MSEESKDKQLSCKSTEETQSNNYSDEEDYDTEEEHEGTENWLARLQHFFTTKLSLDPVNHEIPKVLDDVSVDGIVKYIQSDKCKHIITMAGAGISTSAGIPDFRSPGSGLYDNLAKYDLPHPEAIFDIEYFKQNPEPFFALAKELYPGTFTPTPSHYFIKLLSDKGLLLRHYTQNIDTLEHVSGIDADKLVEAHGSFRLSHCLSCKKEFDQQWVKEKIFADEVPKCTVVDCGGLVKPDIVFFREGLPSRFFELMSTDFKKCDLLIILGTSLTVQPFASLIDNVPPSCPRLLVNREKVGTTDLIGSLLGGGGGLCFDSSRNVRDVCLIGDCDEGCLQLADKLGWKDDLAKLIEKKN